MVLKLNPTVQEPRRRIWRGLVGAIAILPILALGVPACRNEFSPVRDLPGVNRVNLTSDKDLMVFITIEPRSAADYVPATLDRVEQVREHLGELPAAILAAAPKISFVVNAPAAAPLTNEQFLDIDYPTSVAKRADYGTLSLAGRLDLATGFSTLNGGAKRIEAFCADPTTAAGASVFCRKARSRQADLEASRTIPLA